MRDHIEHDNNLLAQARAVFGEDLVVAAYVTTWVGDHDSEDALKKRIADERYESPDLCPDGSIDIGEKEILITFCNGRTISFQSSEWGSISRPNREPVGSLKPPITCIK